MTNSEKPRVRRSPAAPKVEAKPAVPKEEKAVVAEAPKVSESPKVSEAPRESATPQLSPKATVDDKMKEIEARGHADLSTGQRFGAKLIAMAELRNRQ